MSAAFNALERQADALTWAQVRPALVNVHLTLHPRTVIADDQPIPQVPTALIDRVFWLADPSVAHAIADFSIEGGRLTSLFTILLNELSEIDVDRRNIGRRLMRMLVDRPELLHLFTFISRSHPALLADLLMESSTCLLACWLVAEWDPPGSAWNREYRAEADRTTKLLAFGDAMAMFRIHAQTGALPPGEIAALFHRFHMKRAWVKLQVSAWEEMLELLRREISLAPVRLDAVCQALLESARLANDSSTNFAAALDLASQGNCANRITPDPLVEMYLDVVFSRGKELPFPQLGPASCEALVRLAMRSSDELRGRFLQVIDVRRWLAAAGTEAVGDDGSSDLMHRRIRLQIRVLARAVAAWTGEIPSELVAALSAGIDAGSHERVDRSRIDAFAARFEVSPVFGPIDRPIALDIAAALQRAAAADRELLIDKIVQAEEPLFLARLLTAMPATMRERIRQRVASMTPETSTRTVFLPELQARTEALLNAQLPDVAALFASEEARATTGGPVPGREITTMRATLRLMLLRQQWSEIDSYVPPESMSSSDRQSTADVVLAYRGYAAVSNSDAPAAAAEAIFNELHRRHPTDASHEMNLFASRVRRMLDENSFGLLAGDALAEARRYLADVATRSSALSLNLANDTLPMEINRALLSLAANEPREALQILIDLKDRGLDERVEAYRALALARTDGGNEAITLLARAEHAFGRTELLAAVRENIATGQSFATFITLAHEDNPVPAVRHAFALFPKMGHMEQAAVRQANGIFPLYLIEEVRGACASLVALVSMMRNLRLSTIEDDITSVLGELLQSRLLLNGWKVTDQSRGGPSGSARGGVGRRDLLIAVGTSRLAVLEALVVDSVETVNLTAHFDKLLHYDTCASFFHITYARTSRLAQITQHLKGACQHPPDAFEYIHQSDLESESSMPLGFVAEYRTGDRRITATFLVLNMREPNP